MDIVAGVGTVYVAMINANPYLSIWLSNRHNVVDPSRRLSLLHYYSKFHSVQLFLDLALKAIGILCGVSLAERFHPL